MLGLLVTHLQSFSSAGWWMLSFVEFLLYWKKYIARGVVGTVRFSPTSKIDGGRHNIYKVGQSPPIISLLEKESFVPGVSTGCVFSRY